MAPNTPNTPAAPNANQPANTPAPKRGTLAYEHRLKVVLPDEKLRPLFQALQATCQAATADDCTVLNASLNTQRGTEASITFRAKPSGVDKLTAMLTGNGEIISRHTRAEDLAGPIADQAKQLALQEAYRTRLEALLQQPKHDMESLFKLNRELTQVQSAIEELAGKKSQLQRRLDTDLLTVDLASQEIHSAWAPMREAFAEFGQSLAKGMGSSVTGLAYLLPWTLVLLLMAWLVRNLWHFTRAVHSPKSADNKTTPPTQPDTPT